MLVTVRKGSARLTYNAPENVQVGDLLYCETFYPGPNATVPFIGEVEKLGGNGYTGPVKAARFLTPAEQEYERAAEQAYRDAKKVRRAQYHSLHAHYVAPWRCRHFNEKKRCRKPGKFLIDGKRYCGVHAYFHLPAILPCMGCDKKEVSIMP